MDYAVSLQFIYFSGLGLVYDLSEAGWISFLQLTEAELEELNRANRPRETSLGIPRLGKTIKLSPAHEWLSTRGNVREDLLREARWLYREDR